MLMQDVDRQVLAERQIAAVVLAAGAKDVVMPTSHEARAALDAALLADPTAIGEPSEHDDLRQVLGV